MIDNLSRPRTLAGGDRARTVRVSAAVMSNGRVDGALPHILERLAPLRPTVVSNRGNPWRTARAAWAAIAPDATHHLVVQDDVRIAAHLPETLRRLATRYPDTGFACYAQWDTNCAYRVRMAALGGDRVVEASARDWVPSQGLLLPRRACEDVAGLADDLDSDDDEVLAARLYESGHRCRIAITVPNLIEHDDDPMLGFNSAHGLRRAAAYVEDPAVWRDPPAATWDGQGWDEASVLNRPEGSYLDWGRYVTPEPRSFRQIRTVWYDAVAQVGIDAAAIEAIGKRVLGEVGLSPVAAAPEYAAPLREYLAACALYGVAWRHWWRGGTAATPRRDAVSDAAMLTLWRCGTRLALPEDLALAAAWSAFDAGTAVDDVPDGERLYLALARWLRVTRSYHRIW